ncbi:hypothetical protein D9M70_555610 [compost metagenome]
MRDDLLAVEVDDGIGHRSVEDERDLAAMELPTPGERLLIGESALIGGLVEIVERQLHRIVRQTHGPARLQAGGFSGGEAFGEDPGIVERGNRSHHHSYLTEPSIPWTNWRCMKKKTARVGSVARMVPTMTTP